MVKKAPGTKHEFNGDLDEYLKEDLYEFSLEISPAPRPDDSRSGELIAEKIGEHGITVSSFEVERTSSGIIFTSTVPEFVANNQAQQVLEFLKKALCSSKYKIYFEDLSIELI